MKLENLLDYTQPTQYIVSNEFYDDSYKTPVLTAGKTFILGNTNDEDGIYKASKSPIILFDDFTTDTKWVDFDFKVKSSACKILTLKNANSVEDLKYIYYAMINIKFDASQHMRYWISKYSQCKIAYPEKNKRLYVVRTLDSINQIILRERQRLQLLDELIKSRFNEMFGDVDSNTHTYPSFKIGTQFSLGAGGTPSTQNKEYWDNGTISWIGSNMCQNVIIYKNDGKYITEKGYANSSAKLFYPDTVLIALVGATIGKVALLKFETTTNQNVLGMWDIKKNGYNPYYVYYYMQAICGKFKSIGDNFKMASKSFVSNLDILKPSLEKQNEFAYFVEQIDKLKFNSFFYKRIH